MVSQFQSISPADLKTLLVSSDAILLIDVRTPKEFQEVHLTEAVNVPLDQLKPESLPSDGKPVIFICKSGMRGKSAAEKVAAYRSNVYNVEGGTEACVSANMSVIRGKKSMSLERQVRIAAGSLVLVGVALSLFVHPMGILLSAFVGGGLVFAGVTDTCGMAILLSKMPWNQIPAARKTASA